MSSETEYTNIVDAYDFVNLQSLTPTGGQYQLYYAFLNSSDLSSISYYPSTNKWAQDFSGTGVSTYVQNAANAILAPAGTTAWTAYYSDVAKVHFTSEVDTNSLVQIQIGITTDAPRRVALQ